MDKQGENFPGGSPPGRNNMNTNNNNLRGGTGLPNIFSPGLRTIDPQYAAAIDFEELRIRQQLEAQQDMELRRRLMEEQQHQLLSELEYRNKIQQLQELQELQAQQQQQQQVQQQQQGLSQLLAQNPQLLELRQQQQQQQYQSVRDNSLLASLRDDFLLQRHQQMLQDQMQQQLQEQLSRDAQQHEQEELIAMLRASGNLRGVLPQDAASMRPAETIIRQPSSDQSPALPKPPPANSTPVPTGQSLNNSVRQREDSTPTQKDSAIAKDDVPMAKKRSSSETVSMNGKESPQDPPATSAKKVKPVKKRPQPKTAPPKDTTPKANPKEKEAERSAINREVQNKVAKLLESQEQATTKQKEKAPTEKKTRKKKTKKEDPPAKKGAKRKKSPTTPQEGKKASKTNISAEDDSKLSDHEKSVIDFLGSRGAKNGKFKEKNMNGAHKAQAKNTGEGVKDVKERNDKEAADIVLDFKHFKVSAGEVQKAKKWSKENQPRTSSYPVVLPEDVPYISPGLKFNLPSLPIEPELSIPGLGRKLPLPTRQAASAITTDAYDMSSVTGSTTSAEAVKKSDVVEDVGRVRFQKKIFKPKKTGKGQDQWWPSNASIRKERRKLGERQDVEDSDEETDTAEASKPSISFVKAGVEATKERLATSVEPGVMEKLPHCKLYGDFCKEKKSANYTPRFCCQTTETFPFELMVCCSVCSTWRHAQCGGHYKRYTAESVDPSDILFEPICDQCYLEKEFVDENPVAEARIERQRIEHLRRCNATNAVMRQVAFGKHSGQYKWPLGSVSISHISGHTRSVQARHEKAEKQWSEMATRLGEGLELRPRERQRVRTRELERLLVSIEDAEGAMDRHNMMLFLQNDTNKLHPAGFEQPRRNIFDPDEDPVYPPLHQGSTKRVKGANTKSENKHRAKGDPVGSMANSNGQKQESLMSTEELKASSPDEKKRSSSADKEGTLKEEHPVCARQDCKHRARFDSIFCSDSCGVSTLETDLLRTLQYATKLHPTVLRS